ncbi:hypothetical protein GGS23DRAFT_7372 [Durotheca rogersii]|uniref:uncharacterized protein n=1 Tax=Durotheca rogersii TaxID=419775 RepID=UPI00221EAA7E|nr:uncharacterized protein GGS23DRAFT_7372 [Durotheca rogersii]KAI5868017.1 hypothetical protein GGS23DRAFT_7372 [Durotheca rogersii]
MAVASGLLGPGPGFTPATCCQLFYVLATATTLAAAGTPESLRRLFMPYGARSSSSPLSSSRAKKGEEGEAGGEGRLLRAVSWATSASQVPHSWFRHFYVLSLSGSAFWAVQFLCRGRALEFVVEHEAKTGRPSMSVSQVILVWFLMSLQGARRLYESVVLVRPSPSKMWVIHWLLGLAFYLCMSVSIWVEGSGKCYSGVLFVGILINNRVGSIQASDPWSFNIKTLPFNAIIGVPLFLASSFTQYRCHSYLFRLKKYSLPEDGLFAYLVCPHYTCECVLYLVLATVAAPTGQLYNRTLACASLFVFVNLGVTAHGTKRWYGEKFGREKVLRKWRMIPGLL